MRTTAPFPGTRGKIGAKPSALAAQRWLLLPVVLALIAGLIFWWLPSRLAPVTTPTTVTASEGILTISVTGSGTIAAARTVDLPFQQAGTITSVDVKVGDQVKAGQKLAQIDTGDLELALQQAQANLKSAEANQQQVKTGTTTPQDIASAQAQLDSAKAQLQQTKTGTTTKSDLTSAQAQLDAAKAKLDALQHPTPANISAAQLTLNQAQTNLQSQRDNLSQAKTSAYNQMQQAVNSLTQAQTNYASAKSDWEYVQNTGNNPSQPTTTNSNGDNVRNKLSDAQRQQYYDSFVQADASLSSAQTALDQAQLNYDAARQNEATQIPLLEQQVANAQTQYDALMHPSANDLKQAQASVVQAQASLDKLRQGGTAAAIAQSQASVVQAQANLDKLKQPPTDADLASAEANVLQAQMVVSTAQHNLDLATLTAPFDGVVSAVAAVPGGTASASTAAVSLVDRSKLHIDISLSETDAARVAVGQPVALTFDALPDVTINGTVATIAPAATVSQNVVTYPVQVEFDPGSTPVKVGMSATAEIQIQQITNALLVPSRAVQTVGNRHIVTVLQGPQQIAVPVQVETGATSNGQTVVLSCVDTGSQCLQAGDTFAVVTTSTSNATQNGARGGNTGFPGGGGVRVPFGGGR